MKDKPKISINDLVFIKAVYNKRNPMLEFKSFKTFKALFQDIEKKYKQNEAGESKFGRKVLRDYGFTKNWQYAILPNPTGQKDYGQSILIIATNPETDEVGMYSFDACAPIDMAKAKLIMKWVDKNVEEELHFFTTNSWNDIIGGNGEEDDEDAFAKFNTHDKIWIRKHWIDDY